jgi:hypothetical protein
MVSYTEVSVKKTEFPMSINRLALISVALPLLIVSTDAIAESGRYTMTQTKDGVLKLDTKTGAVSLCQGQAAKWSCRPVDDKADDLRDRIARLEKENAQLRALITEKGDDLPMPEKGLPLPSEEEVDKAMDFVERMLKRFKGIVKDLREKDEQGTPL